MIKKGKMYMSNVWKKPKFRIPMFAKGKINLEFQCLEKPKFKLPMFGKAKV